MCPDLTDTMQAVLMIFVLDTAIGFGVWLPFTFGKTTALLSVSGIEISSQARVHTISSA